MEMEVLPRTWDAFWNGYWVWEKWRLKSCQKTEKNDKNLVVCFAVREETVGEGRRFSYKRRIQLEMPLQVSSESVISKIRMPIHLLKI